MPAHGERVDGWTIGPIRVDVRHSCIARDLYEITVDGPLPASLHEALGREGAVRGAAAVLYVVEIAGRHQITVAPARGRLVVMPRLQIDRPTQRADVVALVSRLASLL